MKNFGMWILMAAGGVAAFLFFKRKSSAGQASSQTSQSAKALTAGTTTGTARNTSIKGADSSGQGFAGWLAYGQNVLKNTSGTIQKNQDDTASIRNLGGTFASLWSGGGGAVSAQTSGSGAGVPLDYDSPGANTRANQTNSGADVAMDFAYDPQIEEGNVPSEDFGSYDEGWSFP